MFNCSIEKSFMYDCIEVFIPVNCVDNDLLILISHGSGGVGSAEYTTAEYFLNKGYAVGINNYFKKHNIDFLYWSRDKGVRDLHDVSFYKLLTDIEFPLNKKIVHIGFSLGGFLGLLNANKFTKNYNFYPGILGITENLINTDYSNSTTFIAENDNWVNDYYNTFEKFAVTPPNKIVFENTYHGFMIPNKNRNIYIAKYHFPKTIISDEEFQELKPNHCQLASKYNFYMEDILLQSSSKYSIIALDTIARDLDEHINNIT